MRVTITLGDKAKEFVTGIPEEELPEILSETLEKALRQQVKEIPSGPSDNSSSDLVLQLKDLIESIQQGNTNSTQDTKGFTEKATSIIKEIVKPVTPMDLGDLGDFDNLMK